MSWDKFKKTSYTDLNDDGFLLGCDDVKDHLLHISAKKYLAKGKTRIRVLNGNSLFGVIDIVPFDLNELDKNNLELAMKHVLMGIGGITRSDKRRTQRYINYRVGTRRQGQNDGLLLNEGTGLNKKYATYYQRGEGIGTMPGLLALFPTSLMLNPSSKIYNQESHGFKSDINVLTYLPPALPKIKGSLNHKCTSVAVIPRSRYMNHFTFHYDDMDYNEVLSTSYYTLDIVTEWKSSNMSIAYFSSNSNINIKSKGFILDTYCPKHMVILHINAVKYGHCQYIDNPEILSSKEEPLVEQVVITRFSSKEIITKQMKFETTIFRKKSCSVKQLYTPSFCKGYCQKILSIGKRTNFKGLKCTNRKCAYMCINPVGHEWNDYIVALAYYISYKKQYPYLCQICSN